MAYSKAYQSVEAGRVREEEAIGFFGDNKIAVPGKGTTNFTNNGGSKFPNAKADELGHTGVGKAGTESDVVHYNVPNSTNNA